MQELLRWLASWRGIELEPGTELQLELAAFPSGGLGLLVLLAGAAVVLLVAFFYRRDGKTLTGGERSVLAVLRMLAVLAVMLLLLEPNLVAVKREVRPAHTILLLDVSQSMGQVDAFRRESAQPLAAGWRELSVDDPSSVSRMDLVKALLRHGDGELVRLLSERNVLRSYGFSAGLESLPLLPEEVGDQQVEPAELVLPPVRYLDLAAIEANGRYSNLGGAVRMALQNSRNADIAGVIVLSDGRRNVGAQGAEVARFLTQQKVPHILVLPIGDPSETQFVGVSRIEAPEKVFQKDPFGIRAGIQSQGYEAMSLEVRLVREADDGSITEVGRQQVAVGGDRSEAVVEFPSLTGQDVGRFTYRVEIDPPSGEPANPLRHQVETRIEVLGEQTRVLLISGGPSYEYRVLSTALIRDKTILVSGWLQSADSDFNQDGDEEVRIEVLPEDREDLDVYDVFIFMDADPTGLNGPFCELVAQKILEDGAGLWWVCGEKFSLEAFRDTATTRALVDLLPVVPDVVQANYMFGLGKPFPVPWPYELTPEASEGVAGSITRLADTREASAFLWGRLPGYHVAFPVVRAKPAATVLVRHPSPELQGPDGNMPVLAVQFMGAGRVLFSGMDETYRWRSILEDSYNRFWVKGIRYLFEGRLNAGDSQLRIFLSDERLEFGDSLKVEVEAKDPAYRPLVAASLELFVERAGRPAEPIRLAPIEQAPGRYQTILRPTETGFYRLRPPTGSESSAEASFQVVLAAVEKAGPVNLGELGSLAGASGGELLNDPTDLLDAIDRIPSRTATDVFRTPHSIWDGWVTVAIITLLLATEWWLRKRFNLL